MSKTQSLLKAAWIIAFVTVISKLIGFLRDVVIANYYGAGMVSDAYFYAYQIPALAIVLLGGIGGPFHSAVVSVFSKIIPNLDEKAPPAVNKLFNTFLTTTFLFFLVLAVLCFVFSDVIMGIIISNGSPELIHLAGLHLKIMSPALVVGGVVGIYYGILITYKEFLIPNISPMLMSIAIIAIISLVKNDNTGIVLAAATTVGALCQFVYQLPKLKSLGFSFGRRNLLVTFHPATLEGNAGGQFAELLAALDSFENCKIILTCPNSDEGNEEIFSLISDFEKGRKNVKVYGSLGLKRYLSCMRYVDAVVGNSSSGIYEAPSFGIPTVNIGGRQRGRIQAESIINCRPDRKEIVKALQKAYKSDFSGVKNPYEGENTALNIFRTLKSFKLDGIINKKFYDIS